MRAGRAQRIAAEALSGSVYAPVGHATQYHTLWVSPGWARTLDHVGTIGAHRFYRNRGAGGEKAAFSMAYAGVEPAVSGRTAPAAGPQDDAAPAQPAVSLVVGEPVAARAALAVTPARPAGKGGRRSAATPGAAAPESGNPDYAASGEIRPEYADAGTWKVNPALAH